MPRVNSIMEADPKFVLAMRPATQADFIKTALRLPPELHASLHEAAKASGRTYNAEILSRLEASFSSQPVSDNVQEVFRNIVKEVVAEMNQAETFQEYKNLLASKATKKTKEK